MICILLSGTRHASGKVYMHKRTPTVRGVCPVLLRVARVNPRADHVHVEYILLRNKLHTCGLALRCGGVPCV